VEAAPKAGAARPHAIKTAVKPDSMLMARFLCVVFRITISGLIDIATKINPASAAAPLPSHHATDDVPQMVPLTPDAVRLFAQKALAV